MVAKKIQPCYTVSRITAKKKDKQYMMEKKRPGGFLPGDWPLRLLLAVCAALGANWLLGWIPWPAGWLAGFEQAMEGTGGAGVRSLDFLILTLLLAPVAEEAVFRVGIYGWLGRRMPLAAAAVLSALAFGLYHGNWIQGIYGFFMGLVLAWGYESGGKRSFSMAVLMHGAANLAVLLIFG